MRPVKIGKNTGTSKKIRAIRATLRNTVQGDVLAESAACRNEVKRRMKEGPDILGMFHESASQTINGDTGAYAASIYVMFPRGGSEYNKAESNAQRAYVGKLSKHRHAPYTQAEFERQVMPEIQLPRGPGIITGGISSMLKYAEMWESGSEGFYSPVFLPVAFEARSRFAERMRTLGRRLSSRVRRGI